MFKLIKNFLALESFYFFARRIQKPLFFFTLSVIAVGLYSGLFLAPRDYQQGDAFKLIYFNQKYNSLINKSWFASTVVVILYNITDIVYYDGKFSLLSWILLAGLNCVIEENKNLIHENNSKDK